MEHRSTCWRCRQPPPAPLREEPHRARRSDALKQHHAASLVARGQEISRVVKLHGGDDVGCGGEGRQAA